MTALKASQHVVQRSGVIFDADGVVEARLTVALPARGRSICGDWCREILTGTLLDVVSRALLSRALDMSALRAHVLSVEDQAWLRSQLSERGAVAFVKDGAILPRASGASDTPMDAAKAIPFASPPSMAAEFTLPNTGRITGMLIPKGITLIVGGGFHGKSTLLQALQLGVYDHVPDDGREFVVTDPTAVKIRAEDGRCVCGADISPFINNLPLGRDTTNFSSADASGSTSQAANVVEALELGAGTLLIDEDLAATNALVRDLRMQALVAADKEPITPFVERVGTLAGLGVSTVMVIGGTGDYFSVADKVLMMDNYRIADVTARAKEIATQYVQMELPPPPPGNEAVFERCTAGRSVDLRSISELLRQTEGRVTVRRRDSITFGNARQGAGGDVGGRVDGSGEVTLDLGAVEQLVETAQTRAIAGAVELLGTELARAGASARVRDVLQSVLNRMEAEGLDTVSKFGPVGDLAMPRIMELAAALNRLRGVSFRS
uniref:ABC transporter domain-containing protein n=2 Tax=Phaeomonas parva TaxID=124430 RepID=A0A7S1U7B1_9STRA|mmetsp:Transcript_33568/g.106074  ORF Transcript_33568/g.106074 Transcript_33568/m.106074 type:complete len:493 (+) Transcript_33568:494-1972(+)